MFLGIISFNELEIGQGNLFKYLLEILRVSGS